MEKKLTPLRAIHVYCRQCSGDSPKEVKLCPIPDCPLFNYRFGHNPARKGRGAKTMPIAEKIVIEPGQIEKEGLPNG